MGIIHVRVTLTNARDAVLVRLGQLETSQVRRYATDALIDTGATRSVLPPFVTDRLGSVRLGRTTARYADGRLEEVDTTEPFLVELLGRETALVAMVLGEQVLLGVTVLEELDLLVDCAREQVIPNPAHPDQPVFRI